MQPSDQQSEDVSNNSQTPRRLSRAEFLTLLGVGLAGVVAGGTLVYFNTKNRQQPLPQPTENRSLPLGVTGKFENLQPGQTITGDTFHFAVEEDVIPGNQLNTLYATIWYAGALPDTTTNPKGGWVNAAVEQVNTKENGTHTFTINMLQPTAYETAVPDGPFSLSINAVGERSDGQKGVTEGVPGPINLIYKRTT